MNRHCLICKNQTYGKTDKKGKLFHFCNNCGFVSLDPTFYLSRQDQKKRYNLHNNTSRNTGYINWLQSFIDEAVKPWLEKGSSILDFGSGPNPLLKGLLIDEGYKVDCYDKFFFDHPYIGPYDMITSTEVIEHVENPLDFIENLKQSLKPGALLSIKTLFILDSVDFLTWWYKEDSTHIGFLSYRTFLYISELLNLKIVYTDNKGIIIFCS